WMVHCRGWLQLPSHFYDKGVTLPNRPSSLLFLGQAQHYMSIMPAVGESPPHSRHSCRSKHRDLMDIKGSTVRVDAGRLSWPAARRANVIMFPVDAGPAPPRTAARLSSSRFPCR